MQTLCWPSLGETWIPTGSSDADLTPGFFEGDHKSHYGSTKHTYLVWSGILFIYLVVFRTVCITVGQTEHAENWCDWSTERKEFYFHEVKCFSPGRIDLFLIWNVSHSQRTFLNSDFHWDLQFHLKSPGDLFWICVKFEVWSAARILCWTVPVPRGILGLICNQCCCLPWICHHPTESIWWEKEKVINAVPSKVQVQKELSW